MALKPTDVAARGRREFAAAVLLTAAAGTLGLIAGSRPWLDLRVLREAPLPPAGRTVTGSTLAPLVPGLALVVLAGAVGLLATRRWGRAAVGWAIAVAGAGIVTVAAPWVRDAPAVRAQEVAVDVGLPAGALEATGGTGAILAVLAGTLAVLLGTATLLRSRRWPAMGARYDAPPASRGAAAPGDIRDLEPASEQETWDALDRGEDPTRRSPR